MIWPHNGAWYQNSLEMFRNKHDGAKRCYSEYLNFWKVQTYFNHGRDGALFERHTLHSTMTKAKVNKHKSIPNKSERI